MEDLCDKCEEMMQPFLDGALSVEEVAEAESHLESCSWCAKRYRFEEGSGTEGRGARGQRNTRTALKQTRRLR